MEYVSKGEAYCFVFVFSECAKDLIKTTTNVMEAIFVKDMFHTYYNINVGFFDDEAKHVFRSGSVDHFEFFAVSPVDGLEKGFFVIAI